MHNISQLNIFNGMNSIALSEDTACFLDVLLFVSLELLGLSAIVGNAFLVFVLSRNKYLTKPSFILMFSLALADIIHGLVTTLHFYPPILLKKTIFPWIAVRIWNILDWTAWGITLTHMSAMCLDRLTAIMLYARYNQIITLQRISRFTISCWTVFLSLNVTFFIFNFCCMITPIKAHNYYSFNYKDDDSIYYTFKDVNIFVYLYTPLEISAFCILAISNPITLIQLYRQHKRKVALRLNFQASAMLLEMSVRMGSKHISNELKDMATRKATRQQQRILFQISVVAVIFFSYMTAYYLYIHVVTQNSKWLSVFHSFFYSTTHMINPIIYFIFNKEMRSHLKKFLIEFRFTRLFQNFLNSSNSSFSFQNSTSTKNDKRTNTYNQITFDKTPCENYNDFNVGTQNVKEKEKSLKINNNYNIPKISLYKDDNCFLNSSNISEEESDSIKLTQMHVVDEVVTDHKYIVRKLSTGNKEEENFRSYHSGLSLIDTLLFSLFKRESLINDIPKNDYDQENKMKRSVTMFNSTNNNIELNNITNDNETPSFNILIPKSLTYSSFANDKRSQDNLTPMNRNNIQFKNLTFQSKNDNIEMNEKNAESDFQTLIKKDMSLSEECRLQLGSLTKSSNSFVHNLVDTDNEKLIFEQIEGYEICL